MPAGGSAKFSINGTNAAQNDTVTFTEAGVYGISVTIVDKSGLSVTSSVKVTVAQTLTGISLYSGATKVLVNPSTPLKVTGTSQTLTAMALDQFGNALAIQPSFTWASTSYPSGAKPSFTGSGSTETVAFHEAGSYGVSVSASGTSRQVTASASIVVVGHPTAFRRQPSWRECGRLRARRPSSPLPSSWTSSRTRCRRLPRSRGRRPAPLSGAAAPQFTTSGSTTTVKFVGGRHIRPQRHADRCLR